MELGSIAAAAQFLDLGCRSLFGIYRFVKDLKDVPADLLQTLQDLERVASFMTDLQDEINTDGQRLRTLSPTQLDRTTQILDTTGDVFRELETLLAPCRPAASSSRTSKVWRAFVSIKRERDIVKKCERLERLKHDLNRELQNCELTLLSSMK